MRARASLAGILLLCAGAGEAIASQDPSRVRLARVALEGPLGGASLSYPDGSATHIEVQLARGERRTVDVPLAPPRSAPELQPAIAAPGEGRARLEVWLERDPRDWERWPLGVRMRPWPPPLDGGASASGGRPPIAALLLSACGFLLVLRFRSRPIAALAWGLAGAASVLLFAAPGRGAGRALHWIEGEAESDRWLSVLVVRNRFACEPDPGLRLATAPAEAALEIRASFEPSPRWSFASPGATLYVLAEARAPEAGLRREGPNRWAPLAEAWLREPGGAWSRRGPWPLGAALPAARSDRAEPPGWTNPGLAPGRGILVGRCASAPPLAPVPSTPDETWLRLVGF